MTHEQPNVVLMTLVIGVAHDKPECLYGGRVVVGTWGHGMALGTLVGPSDEGPTKFHSHDFGVRGGQCPTTCHSRDLGVRGGQ